MKRTHFLAVIIASVSLLSGCAGFNQGGNPDVYARNQAMSQGKVIEATVIQVRDVTIGAGNNAKTIGAVTGGLAGAAITNNRSGLTQTSAILFSGLAGNMAASTIASTQGQEIIVRLNNQDYQAIVQERGKFNVQPGQKVLVLINGQESRIVSRL